MNSNNNMSQVELKKALEKAKKDAQAMLEKMTPEERMQAEINAKKLIEEDTASRQKLLDDAARVLGNTHPRERSRFCTSCGAPAGAGIFCEYCGSPLQN